MLFDDGVCHDTEVCPKLMTSRHLKPLDLSLFFLGGRPPDNPPQNNQNQNEEQRTQCMSKYLKNGWFTSWALLYTNIRCGKAALFIATHLEMDHVH